MVAWSMSASSSTSSALLPPSSRDTFLSWPGRRLGDPPAHGGGPGEVDHGHVGVADQPLARLDVAGQHLEDARRRPGGREQLGDGQPAAVGRLRGRLDQHGVAQRERGGDHPHAEDEREVPRGDDADQPERDPLGQREPAGVPGGQHLAGGPGGQRGRLGQLAGRGGDLVVGLARDAAGLPHDQLAPFLGPVGQHRGGGTQQPGALGVGPLAPGPLGGQRRGHRRVGISRAGQPGQPEDLTGGLVPHRQRPALRGTLEGAVQEHRLLPRLLACSHPLHPSSPSGPTIR